jgi:hypothetical protein
VFVKVLGLRVEGVNNYGKRSHCRRNLESPRKGVKQEISSVSLTGVAPVDGEPADQGSGVRPIVRLPLSQFLGHFGRLDEVLMQCVIANHVRFGCEHEYGGDPGTAIAPGTLAQVPVKWLLPAFEPINCMMRADEFKTKT